jgi:hypothetical protein
MRYLIYLTLLVSASLNAGTIHKWVDEQGNVHYGDSPPVATKTEDVRVLSAPSNPGKALPRLSTPSSEQNGDSSNPAAATDPTGLPEDQAKLACDNAREDLQVINRSSRVKLRNSDGTTRYLTTEEIEDRKTQAEADVERFCQ